MRRERDSRIHRCHLDARPLKTAAEFIECYGVFWTGALDPLARYLEGGDHGDDGDHGRDDGDHGRDDGDHGRDDGDHGRDDGDHGNGGGDGDANH